MKIIYAPEYDEENQLPFSNHQFCLLNTIYVGNAGLLSQLELRLGLSSEMPSEVEREAYYLNAIRKHKENAFYEKAADKDELGVAHKLLQWREELMMAGWTPLMKGISKKLDDMAELESDYHVKGMADRWREVKDHVLTMTNMLSDLILIVDTEEYYLPYLIRETISILQQQEACSYSRPPQPQGQKDTDLYALQKYLFEGSPVQLKHDGTLRLLHFKENNDAYEWFASTDHEVDTVVVNQDNLILNQILSSWDQPQSQVKIANGNPQITQLFKLGLSLYETPLNIYNLLSYLQIPLHPLPGLLRKKLAEVLSNEGGINEKWFDTIEKYQFDDDPKEDKKIRQKKSIFLKMVNTPAVELQKEDVLTYTAALQLWANGYLQNPKCDKATHDQLNTLISFCKAFHIILQDMDVLDRKTLNLLVRNIYRSSSYLEQAPQANSRITLNDIYRLASPASHLVWLDCVSHPTSGDPYNFLSTAERKKLNDSGMVDIPEYTRMLQHQRAAMIRTLCQIKHSLTLVTTDYEGNQKTNEHPFIAELKMILGEISQIEQQPDTLPHQEIRELSLHHPHSSYTLPHLSLPERCQSNTSLNTLIQYPFDYVMEHIAYLNEPRLSELKDLKTTKGLVAHRFIQELITDTQGNLSRMRECYASQFESRVEQAIQEVGALLELQENHIEKTNFVWQLKKSIETLLTIMETFHLQPVGSEVEIQVGPFFDYGDFRAKIDCLLKNKEGKYVIFDFKWSQRKEYYSKLIKDNQAMQLELYKWAIEHQYGSGSVAAVAYYLFPECTLITNNFPEIPDGSVQHVERAPNAADSLLEVIHRSLDYRRQQLLNGYLEEGEEFPLSDLSYAQDSESKELFPLNESYQHKNCKGSPYVDNPMRNKFETLSPVEISTTHAILKNRLK